MVTFCQAPLGAKNWTPGGRREPCGRGSLSVPLPLPVRGERVGVRGRVKKRTKFRREHNRLDAEKTGNPPRYMQFSSCVVARINPCHLWVAIRREG